MQKPHSLMSAWQVTPATRVASRGLSMGVYNAKIAA